MAERKHRIVKLNRMKESVFLSLVLLRPAAAEAAIPLRSDGRTSAAGLPPLLEWACCALELTIVLCVNVFIGACVYVYVYVYMYTCTHNISVEIDR